ncbi:unnamed protein product [Caenorhabditis brenneri]
MAVPDVHPGQLPSHQEIYDAVCAKCLAKWKLSTVQMKIVEIGSGQSSAFKKVEIEGREGVQIDILDLYLSIPTLAPLFMRFPERKTSELKVLVWNGFKIDK